MAMNPRLADGAAVVTGLVADGAAVSGNPVLVAGQDGTNVQTLLTDTTGAAYIAGGVFPTKASDEETRPADTNAYAIGDAIANSTTASSVTPLTFTVARANGFSGRVIGAHLITDSATAFAAIRLHLFNTTPFAAAGFQADNSALALTYTALTTGSAGSSPHYIGSIDFETFIAHSASARSIGQASPTALVFDCAAANQLIFRLILLKKSCRPATGTWKKSAGFFM